MRAALSPLVALLCACSSDGYRVELLLPDDFERARIGRVELAVLKAGGCARIEGADAPVDADVERAFVFGLDEEPTPVGELEDGRWGFGARVHDRSCMVVLAGCRELALEAGGEGTITVVLQEAVGPGCEVGESCRPNGECAPPCSRDVDCDDDIACTEDLCQDERGQCLPVPDHSRCGAGELCDALLGCSAGAACAEDADCADGDPCNGDERCDERCQAGLPIVCAGDEVCDVSLGVCAPAPECTRDTDCDDGVACTLDSCLDPEGVCDRIADHGACEVGELCDPAAGCEAAPGCTVDGDCGDGDLCNGTETCNGGFCSPAAPLDCVDGDPCTRDLCDAATGCARPPLDVDGDGELPLSCGGTDCDDGDDGIGAGAADAVGNGVDENCDGLDGVDGDGDGWPSLGSGGLDCDDQAAARHPGAADNAPPGTWSGGRVSSPGDIGGNRRRARLAVGPDGTVHVAQPVESGADVDVRCYRDRTGVWQSTVVASDLDGDETIEADVAVDSSGVAWVSYYDDSLTSLILATDADGGWDSDAAASDGDSGRGNAVAVDGEGLPHAVFLQTLDGLGYVVGDVGLGWLQASPGGLDVRALAIALDASDVPHVSSCDMNVFLQSELMVSSKNLGVWGSDVVAGACEDPQTSIVVDANGARHVVYEDLAGVRWVTDASGAWVDEAVLDGAATPSIAIAPDGTLHVALYDGAAIAHATRVNGAWELDEVDAAASSTSTDIGVGPDGVLHVAYFVQGDLWVASTDAGVADFLDQDCDGADGVDADGDGFGSRATGGPDCNDADDTIHPNAADAVDRLDRNCDGAI